MRRIRQYFQSYNATEWFLLAVFAILTGWLIYCNLLHMDGSVEADVAKTMVHAMEMGKHRTFYLRDWDYWTNAEWDFSAAPAAVLYALTGNIFLSFGIVNSLNIFLWAVILVFLLRHMSMERVFRLLTLCAIFGSYDWGDVWYTADMLFFGVGWYVYRVLIPLLFLTVLTTGRKSRKTKRNIAALALLAGLVFVTGASSGTYVFLCGLFPVLICMVVYSVLERHIERYDGILAIGVTLCTAAGVYICNRLKISPNSTSMMLRSVQDIQETPFKTFFSLLEVWHVFPQTQTAALSFNGMAEMTKLVFVVILLAFGMRSLKYTFGIGALATHEHDRITTSEKIRAGLISIFVWNYCILFLTRTTARYQLLGAVPLVVCAGYGLQEWYRKIRRSLIQTAVPMLAGVCALCVTLYSARYALTTHFHQADGVVSFEKEADAVFADLDIHTVYVLGMAELCEELRLYDTDRLYVCLNPADEMRGVNRIYYYSAHDRLAGTDKNAIIAMEPVFELCPQYVQDSYTKLDTAYRFDAYFNAYAGQPDAAYYIWVSDNNPLDGIAGVPGYGDGMDLPCSPGYSYQGTIAPDGSLYTSETGVVMESVPLEIIPYGIYRVELQCEADDLTDVRVELLRGEESYATLEPERGGQTYGIDLTEYGSYRIRVSKTGDSGLRIKWISYQKLLQDP